MFTCPCGSTESRQAFDTTTAYRSCRRCGAVTPAPIHLVPLVGPEVAFCGEAEINYPERTANVSAVTCTACISNI